MIFATVDVDVDVCGHVWFLYNQLTSTLFEFLYRLEFNGFRCLYHLFYIKILN